MAFDYAPIAATATRLIENFGSTVVLQRSTEIHRPVSGEVETAAPLEWSASGVRLTRYKGQVLEQYDEAFRKGLVVGKSALFLLQGAGLDRSPEPGDMLVVSGAVWRVVGSTELNPSSSQPVIYFLGVTK